MTLKKDRAYILNYAKLCASFQSYRWIQTGVTVRNLPIWVKINEFSNLVTTKFYGWPWKIIGHLFYATSSFVHHFIAACEFKLEIRTRLNSVLTSVTLTVDLWLWPFAWASLSSMVITPENFMMIVKAYVCTIETMVGPVCIRDRHCMMTSSNGDIFRVTGPLCGEWWIPLTKSSDTELWCFLLSAPGQTVE